MKDDLFILKHDDLDVAEFKIAQRSNNVDYLRIFDTQFSPVNSGESEISQIVSFNGWLTDRCISNSRDGLERLKNKYKISDMKQIMILMYGLSLSDHYWIERKPYNNKWKEINLFENRYDERMGMMLFDKKIKLVDNIVEYGYKNPDITTGGTLKKYWTYNAEENKNYLIKGGSRPDLQEPFNEYFAHLLLTELSFKHTPYYLEKREDEYVSGCPCIADINNEMVSAIDLKRKYGIEKSYYGLLDLGKKMNCTGFEDNVNEMIVLDYLIDNIDRHWYNFGVLRDSVTGAWVSMIPIFDNGYSLWNKDSVNNKIISESMSFADSNEECINLININNYVNKMPDMVGIFDKAFDLYENKARKKELRDGVKLKINDIENHFRTNNGT